MLATPLLGARLSSLASATAYPAQNAIDGDVTTLAASGLETNPWLSVEMGASLDVAYIAVYNRDDVQTYQAWLSPFEVALGDSYGDMSSPCSPQPVSVPTAAGPFLVSCGRAKAGRFVTLRLAGGPRPGERYLTIAELKVFAEPAPASPPSRPSPALGAPSQPSPPPLRPLPPRTDFARAASRPNILIYLLDDWPYEMWPSVESDQRGRPTNYRALLPALSRYAVDEGMAIRTMYTQPMSAPSRRSLFSGRFMTRVGRPFGGGNSLSTQITTLGERMKAAGYATFFAGKWFLGCAPTSA